MKNVLSGGVPIHLHLFACYNKHEYMLTFQAYVCVMG